MTTRYFVYDITTTMEEFVASFASRTDANEWGQGKFGANSYVSDVAHHDKIKLGHAKKSRKRSY